MPEVTLNVFGLFADITLDLPPGSVITQDRIGQFKYGADVAVQALDWLGLMLRWDEVNYNLDHPGYVFSAITPRVTFSSHFLSGESIYIQYSRYRYGDKMVTRREVAVGHAARGRERHHPRRPVRGSQARHGRRQAPGHRRLLNAQRCERSRERRERRRAHVLGAAPVESRTTSSGATTARVGPASPSIRPSRMCRQRRPSSAKS